MSTKMYFAGVNGGHLEEATRGQRVLLSFAEYLKSPSLWDSHRERLESGFWKSAILDSGAFTELSQRKKGKTFTVPIAAYVDFVQQWGHLFEWCANLDDIEGDVDRSNSNYSHLRVGTAARIVPVYHEGESLAQLAKCVADARATGGLMAVGAQRPKGKLVPTKVVEFLHGLTADLEAMDATDVEIHGFGFPRYASSAAPKGAPKGGFPIGSVDSTTWIAEACAAFRAGCTETRREAFFATIDSYQGMDFRLGVEPGLPRHGVAFDHEAAQDPAAHGQARTVSRRLKEVTPPCPSNPNGSGHAFMYDATRDGQCHHCGMDDPEDMLASPDGDQPRPGGAGREREATPRSDAPSEDPTRREPDGPGVRPRTRVHG